MTDDGADDTAATKPEAPERGGSSDLELRPDTRMDPPRDIARETARDVPRERPAETVRMPRDGLRDIARDAQRDQARDPPRDSYRGDALRERLREGARDTTREGGQESMRESGYDPLRDMFRDAGREPPYLGAAGTTPAAHFAPTQPGPTPAPQTVIVRQPWMVVLVIVILLLGIAGAGLLGWQLRLLQGQMADMRTAIAQSGTITDSVSRLSDAATQANEIAGQALVTATRPWIGVDTVEAGPIVAGQPLNIEVRVRNSGRTPSVDVQGLFLVYISPIDSPPAQLSDQCTSCVRSVLLPNGTVSYKLSVRDSVMTPTEVQRIKDGKDTMWIVGRIDYHDADGELHTTRSCLYYRSSGIAAFTACNDGNSAS